MSSHRQAEKLTQPVIAMSQAIEPLLLIAQKAICH